MRHVESRPIFHRIQKALFVLSGRYLPKSAMGKAIAYALGQWPRMEPWLNDGHMDIDNNLVEPEQSGDSLPQAARRASEARQNAIRPTALGKKNWLFFGDAQAGQRSAILYTIIENCRREGINPSAYLRDVLTRLPKMTNQQIAQVTPRAWAKAQKGPVPLATAA